MGKAAKFKQLRKIAAQLPDVGYYQKGGWEKEYGSELIKMGIVEVKGMPVDPKRIYYGQTKVKSTLNHNRKIKEAYNKAGLQGAASYGNAVRQFVKSQKEKIDNNEHNLLK